MTVTQMDPDVVTIRPVRPRTHRAAKSACGSAHNGCICGCASHVDMSAAAIRHRCGMPPPTFMPVTTRSCNPLRTEKRGGGATCTRTTSSFVDVAPKEHVADGDSGRGHHGEDPFDGV